MASLATFAAAQPTVVRGLAGSSIAGTKLHVRSPRVGLKRSNRRAGAVVASYGENSVYFDLDDIANTTGQWDVYGNDGPSPYNALQSKFFLTFAAPFTKRGLLLKFLLLGGGALLAYVSSQASGDVLPIVKGPQLPPKPGPRGKI
ncbi:photosystem I reaction center subunit VI, chloroplastic-like [Andrographis paniculata]|uniref:photosystem I reaction center subunit VI, chloroplastic-like n=1 Tax=Andrographis paniculata TaxID=175694 RepID=UPI0021E90DAD|nr:photosystem I reaction center subunit VI, chloroplastic-like [Andrographis paniculata]